MDINSSWTNLLKNGICNFLTLGILLRQNFIFIQKYNNISKIYCPSSYENYFLECNISTVSIAIYIYENVDF